MLEEVLFVDHLAFPSPPLSKSSDTPSLFWGPLGPRFSAGSCGLVFNLGFWDLNGLAGRSDAGESPLELAMNRHGSPTCAAVPEGPSKAQFLASTASSSARHPAPVPSRAQDRIPVSQYKIPDLLRVRG
jgi:hypothetical protein